MSGVTFRSGVHPASNKGSVVPETITPTSLPDTIVLSLLQHVGRQSKPTKMRGERVGVGELIGEADGTISANIHSPVAGTVRRIFPKPLPGGRMADHVEINVDVEETKAHEWDCHPVDLESSDRNSVLRRIADAGIVGMGGAAFPTHIKYGPPATLPIDTLIVNGAECEPYLTCDYALMIERAAEIISAVKMLHQISTFKSIYFGIEENKPAAVSAFTKALHAAPELRARVVVLKVKYPQGSEKMLIKAITGKIVPAGGLPLNIGIIVSNPATLSAVYDAFYLRKPLVERVVTVSGRGIRRTQNRLVRIGTSYEHLVSQCGGISNETSKIVVGGPMMGTAVPTLDYSVMKGTSGIIFLTDKEIPEESPCIKCGKCVRVCPMNLMPLKLAAYAKARNFAATKTLNVSDCFECGSCAYACPAKIRIVAWIRYAKNHIRQKGL